MSKKGFKLAALVMVMSMILAACQPTPGAVTPEAPEIGLEGRIAEVLRGDVNDFQIVEINVAGLRESIESGRIKLPFANKENQIVELDLPIARVQLRAPDLVVGYLRDDKGEVERIPLPPEQNFQIGECVTNRQEFNNCGTLTLLDNEYTMISGLLIDRELGTTFFEPVATYVGVQKEPGMHLIYNMTGTQSIDFGECISSEEGWSPYGSTKPLLRPVASRLSATALKSTSIVLDGDVQFYNINTSTVWSRQEEVFNAVTLVYWLIEPLSVENPNTDTWGLDLEIKGQEVWVSGGPTTTDGDSLVSDITNAAYYLITPVTDTELHYLYVGYDVTGLYGQAAGIGTAAAFGGAAGKNHAFGEARSTQSLKTRWVVMAHEVGHLLGGRHGDGILNGCTTFFIFFEICGDSIMLAGGAGAPETRAPFFSDKNDINITTVLNGVLP